MRRNAEPQGLTRRTFVGALTGVTGAVAGSALFGCSQTEEKEPVEQESEEEPTEPTPNPIEADPEDQIVWSSCCVNCASHCAFQWHVRDGKVAYMESDNTGDDDFQLRACLRGRSMRRWLNSPDRLMYPMKRVGKRGEGKFEQISWDEAITIVHDKLQQVIDDYGNEAVYVHYGSGVLTAGEAAQYGGSPARLMSFLGGYLSYYGNYSVYQLMTGLGYTYGPGGWMDGSSIDQAANSDLIVMWGNNPAETRMGGNNVTWDFARVREAVEANGGKIISIDPRLNDTAAGHNDEWIPIRPGTDAALANALVHEFIVDGKVDESFIRKVCVGYDEETMPEAYQGKNLSYLDYIMGKGYDMVEKTPEWAAPITQIPADKIRELAKELEEAKAPFIDQGTGPQRHSNGENEARAIAMVAIILGAFGLPGTNPGNSEAMPFPGTVGNIPIPPDPVEVQISHFSWLDAIDHGPEMTATNAGVRGAEKLNVGIKFLWNNAGNCLTNQHGEINRVHEILSDESKCEMIVVCDTVMTDSAKYADVLLPDVMSSEQVSLVSNGDAEWFFGCVAGRKAQDAPGECRTMYDFCADLAEAFGVREEFTEGKTKEEWLEQLYNEARDANPGMPEWEAMLDQGVYKATRPTCIGMERFRTDPEANPLTTPSGKIEIFSEGIQQIAETWEYDDIDVFTGVPTFDPGREGYGSVTDEFPLYGCGYHTKTRTHSSYGFIREIEQAARHQMWINPADAESRGIANGDQCSVKSPRGEVLIEAKVTPRVIPGTIMIPQGAWHNADMFGDKVDKGGCINTLTMSHPTPFKGNPSHTFICEVAKA